MLLLAAIPAHGRSFPGPTNSSPIAISNNGQLVWVVNPGGDNVAVIRTRDNRVIKRIKVGNEPQGVALDPNNRYAYVANTAAGTVTVIRITNDSPRRFRAKPDRRVGRRGALVTGAEPWNIVTSPDGRRVFVANSGQDSVTVIDGTRRRKRRRLLPPRVIGHVNLRGSACSRDPNFHFQPRGLAVTQNNKRLYVTSFLAFTRPGGRQADDAGRQGLVCRLNIRTKSRSIRRYRPSARIELAPQPTGFAVDASGDGVADPTSAFPNQLQSVVARGNRAYLPNIAASPDGPVRFNVNTHAFVNVIDGARDASAEKFLNLHLGAREPEAGKERLFFANAWAIGFTSQRGSGNAYVVSAGSDLLVKANVAGDGKLSFTVDENTTRYIDLRDPDNPQTSGENAGINPQGIAVNRRGSTAYVNNFVSRNVSVVDLRSDEVEDVIRIADLPDPGSQEEVVSVGADMFFSSRGVFDRPAGAAVRTETRLSSEGWQSCASCHFKGLTDGVVWEFPAGPRKSVPLNASFNPDNRNEQRLLNYSAIFDEVEDFELNVRNVSGPGALAAAQPCQTPPPATSAFDPNQGLIVGDNGDINFAPCVINAFAKANANRPQVTVTPPGSTTAVPAMTALREWVRFAVRTPDGPLTRRGLPNRLVGSDVSEGEELFTEAGCANCHGTSLFTNSRKNFTSPPPTTEIFTETAPAPITGSPVGVQYFNAALRNIGSFNLGVPGAGNELGGNVGAAEKAAAGLTAGVAGPQGDALGIDYNNDGRGNGYNIPSLLGIEALPPYYHNGACETLACVLDNVKHRTANGTLPDRLTGEEQRAAVVDFLRSID